MGSTLGAVEPVDVTETTTDLTLLELLLGHLLLLLGLELHVRVVLNATVDGTADDRVGGCADGGAGNGAARSAVLKAIEADGGITALSHTAVIDVPLLRAQGANELFVVRNEDNTTLEVADGDGETTKGVTIQEVGRLVKHQKMGVVPHGTSDDDLDLLSTRQRADLVVVGNLGVETKILKVLGDDLGLELTVTKTLTRRLVIIKLLDELVKAQLNQGLARDLGVVLGQKITPFTVAC